MKVTLLLPTLNEIDGMREIMPRIRRDWCHQLLIVDGGSTDGTIEYATENGYDIFIQQERGPRQAYREAIARAEGDVVLTFSPDGNCIPELIPAVIDEMRQGYDMVIASRYLGDAKSQDDSMLSGFGNWMFTNLINRLHGGRYTDAMNIFRAWKKNVFYDLDLDKDATYRTPEFLFFTLIGIEPILSVRAAKRKLKVAEIPGDEPARIGGVAKLQIVRWGSAYLFQVLREVFLWK